MAPYGPSLRLGLIAYYTSADRRTRSRDDTAHLTTPFSIRRPRSSRCRCAAFGKRKPNVRYQKGRKMNDLIHRINNNVFLLLPLQSINEREIKNDLMTRSAEPQLLPPRHFFCVFLSTGKRNGKPRLFSFFVNFALPSPSRKFYIFIIAVSIITEVVD